MITPEQERVTEAPEPARAAAALPAPVVPAVPAVPAVPVVAGANASATHLAFWTHISMPARYRWIVLGSGLLMLASAASAPLGPLASTWARQLLTCCSSAVAIALLIRASLPARHGEQHEERRRDDAVPAQPGRTLVSVVSAVLAAALALGTLLTFAGSTTLILHAPASRTYATDTLSLAHEDADLVLAGRNPYTSASAFRDAARRFPLAMTTPLRSSTFGEGYAAPAPSRILAAQRQYTRAPASEPGAFDPATAHSYPALSFLLYVPLVWAGVWNILVLHLLIYWALLAWLIWLAPVGWRHWGALVGLAAMPTMAASLIAGNEVVVVALVLVAWHLRRRPWASVVLLGLACAYKQYAWFFVPFFALDALQTVGWRESLRRGVALCVVFLVPNLPYLIASPWAWFQSLWLPMSEPLFAYGIGIVALPPGHIVPFAPPWVYALLEALALVALLALYARWRVRIGDAALLLALVPLFFAFRSLPNYFAFLPWLALYAANRRYARALPPAVSPVVAFVLSLLPQAVQRFVIVTM